MEITYAMEKVEKYFKDYKKMQKKLPFEVGENNKKAYGQTKSGGMFWRFFEIEIRKA